MTEPPEMKLTEWEVWHTFASFLDEPPGDVTRAARQLVQSGIAAAAVTREGNFYFLRDDQICPGALSWELNPAGSRAVISVEPQIPPTFAGEAVVQAGHFRYIEKRLYTGRQHLPPAYARCYIEECILESSTHSIGVYPVVTLFSSGVVLIELRLIGPDRPIAVSDFIENYLNVFQHEFDGVLIPPSLAAVTLRVGIDRPEIGLSPRMRWGFEKLYARLQERLDSEAEVLERGDFTHRLVPIGSGPDKGALGDAWEGIPGLELNIETTTEFACTLFAAVAYAMSGPRSGLDYVLRGQKSLNEPGDYWSIRPHVHITRFLGQEDTASENEKSFGEALESIFRREIEPAEYVRKNYLPQSTRAFDDFGAYIGEHLSLWVWANDGIERQRSWADPNRGHLVYENQSKAQLIEYGITLQRAISSWGGSIDDPAKAISARERLLELETSMELVSGYGELREMFADAWKKLGVDDLRARNDELLALRESKTSLAESRRNRRVGLLLTTAFGFVAVPSLAEAVVLPLMRVLGLWIPESEAAQVLYGVGWSVVLFIGALLTIWKLMFQE